jgi:ubiquinone/menaquinone biosynthesis C-methylase UbiE
MTTAVETQIRKCGKDVDSRHYWAEQTAEYVEALNGDYHTDRLRMIDELIPRELYAPGRHVFDFGCGDAVHFPAFVEAGALIQGVDIAPEMIARAAERLQQAGHNAALARLGDVSALKSLRDGELDALLSFNVLAYLTSAEERTFYEQARRVIRPGGHLIVTHSNELFDLYSLNRYTLDFMRTHLVASTKGGQRLGELLACPDEPAEAITYNVRENPLAYRFKLSACGFDEVQQGFSNRHRLPPRLMPENRDYPDTLNVPDAERWKLLFVCSTFGSRSVRR